MHRGWAIFVNLFTISAISRRPASSQSMRKISDPAARRLSLYLRALEALEASGEATASSRQLAEMCGITGAQLRKDLSLFGSFGKRGLGYPVSELIPRIRGILGLSRSWRVALVGAGRIGSALVDYPDFRDRGFHIVAVLDADPRKVGRPLGSLTVRDVSELEAVAREEGLDMVILAVPAAESQALADRAVAAGIRGILNFAPTRLRVPPHVTLNEVNMGVELEALAFVLAEDGSPE